MPRRATPVRVRLNAPAVWRWLAEHDLSQNDLARRLGVSTGYLSQLICGKRGPSAEMRRRISALAPDRSFEDLFIIEHVDGQDGR